MQLKLPAKAASTQHIFVPYSAARKALTLRTRAQKKFRRRECVERFSKFNVGGADMVRLEWFATRVQGSHTVGAPRASGAGPTGSQSTRLRGLPLSHADSTKSKVRQIRWRQRPCDGRRLFTHAADHDARCPRSRSGELPISLYCPHKSCFVSSRATITVAASLGSAGSRSMRPCRASVSAR